MTTEEQLIELLVQADEWRQDGRTFSVAELCPDRPELWPSLKELLEGVRRLDEQMHVAEASFDGVGSPAFASGSNHLPNIPGFELLREIGRGGMGVVYQARQLGLDRQVALKMILAGSYANSAQLARFRKEAETIARLRHPNVVQIFGMGEQDGRPYFSMEYVEGGSLDQTLARRPQAPRAAAELVETLARAVHAAHQQGVVHRDLKPANILLTPEGTPKITDFGLAKRVQEEIGPTGSQIVGTPSYLPPEQLRRNGAAVGPAADIYALGVILYEMFTGRVPHQGENSMETALLVLGQEPTPPTWLQPKLPPDLETITLKCLSKNPQRRYATAGELADDLRRWLDREPIRARPASRAEHVVRWCQRRPALAAMAAALLATAILGFGGVTWQLLRAEAAKKAALQEKAVADAERAKAVQMAKELRLERDAAEWRSYRASMAAAASALEVHNLEAARRSLAAAPRKHRNWEWRYFFTRLEGSQSTLVGHEKGVLTVTYSPDGRRIVTGSADWTVRVWDSATGRQLAVLHDVGGAVASLRFSPDGERLAVGGLNDRLCIWDAATHHLVAQRRGPRAPSRRLVFSPDGRFLTGLARDSRARLWDGRTGKLLRTLGDAQAKIVALAFSPDGRQLLGGDDQGALKLWDVANGDLLQVWQAHSAGALGVAFSPDGSRIVSYSEYPDSALRLWRPATGELIADMTGHKNSVSSVAFSPDGARLVSASWDQTARLWDASKGNPIATLRGHRSWVAKAVFSPDGDRLVTGAFDRSLRLWDGRQGDLLAVLQGHAGKVFDASFSPDGAGLASASEDATLRVWDVEFAERNSALRGHDSYVYDVAYSPDGAQAASAAWDGTVRLWDASTGQTLRVLLHDEQIIVSVAFRPDGRRLASVARGNRVYLWDAAAGEMAAPPVQASTGLFPSGALPHSDGRAVFDPTGALLAAAGGKASVHLWDASGKPVATFGEGSGSSFDVAFSPSGAEVASAERDGAVRIWRVPSGEEMAVLRGHQSEVCSVCYSRDGALLASGGNDRTARLWDARTHVELAALPHGGAVYRVAFSPDGTRLATACHDNSIRLWDIATRDEVAELRGHEDYVHAVAFSPDGSQLVSCSGDHTVRIWDTLSPAGGIEERKQ